MNNKIYLDSSDAEESSSGGDAGFCFNFRCPKCKEMLVVGQHQWWSSDCDCGYTWSLELQIVGQKY